jgi:hypothetical protein
MSVAHIGQLLRAASMCRSQHDPRFIIELGYEIARRHQHSNGAYYEECPVCVGLNEIERAILRLVHSLVPSAALLDARAEVHHDDAE